MRRLCACLVMLSFGVGVVPGLCRHGGNPPPPQDASDSKHQPLPPGALFRLGKYHFQHFTRFPSFPFVYAPDRRHLLTVAGADRTMKFWDVASGRPVSERVLPQGADAFAVSPDGKLLAAGSAYDSMLYVWSAKDGTPISEFRNAGAWRVAFSADGTKVLDVGTAGVIQTFDVAGKKRIRRTPLEKLPRNLRDNDSDEGVTNNLVFSRDGKIVAGVIGEDVVRLWDVASGKELRRFAEPKRKARLVGRALAFSRDGKYLAAAGPRLTVSVWEVATGRKRHTLQLAAEMPDPDEGGIIAEAHLLAYSPDGKYLAANAGDDIQLWESATGKKAKSYPVLLPSRHAVLTGLTFSEDGRNVVGVSGSALGGAIVVWDIATDQLLGHPGGSVETHQDLRFFPDGRRAFTNTCRVESAKADRREPALVRETVIWEVATGKRLHAAPLGPVGHSPDGKYLLTGTRDDWGWGGPRLLGAGTDPVYFNKYEDAADTGTSCTDRGMSLYLVAAETGKVLHRLPAGDAVFDRQGRTLAVCPEGAIQIFDCATGKLVRQRKLDRGQWCLWGSADLSRFLIQDTQTVRLLDVTQGKELWRRPSPCRGFTGTRKEATPLERPIPAVISADEKICTVVRPDELAAWDMRSGKELWRRPTPSNGEALFREQFSPDGKRVCLQGPKEVVVIDLASGDEQYRIPVREKGGYPWIAAFLGENLLRVADGDQVGLWQASGKFLRKFDLVGAPDSLAASRDGKLLAVPGKSGTITVWEIATGQPIEIFTSPESVQSVLFSPDGKTLVSRGDQITLVWDLTGRKFSPLKRPVPLAPGDHAK